ncbi:ATPase AAA [Mycobacterium sp. ST-F2]|uniref:AAA family ATPase n=1 Tax=Mycobacterium sp. ST-F2 TaxID=1490484 RepID=UPI00093CEC4F|nr:AAA family ATPase [Mycobacterium sp. ST-F2]OKH85172.1 ATPase AAA [Mycobacterium sp. ST-F2]
MSEVETGTFARVAAISVESVGRRLIDAGLGRDDSLLTPGVPVWTREHLDALIADYVDKPDTGGGGFFTKLEKQLANSSPVIIQLFAELLILQSLPIINLGGKLKVAQVEGVLKLSGSPVDLPSDVRAALMSGGVFHGGQAFTTYRWAQLVYLITFARHFKSLSVERRVEALSEPLAFREEVLAIPTGQAAQRQSLLYLAFPQYYLPVVKASHRKSIRDSFASEFLAGPTGDIDEDLNEIYEAMVAAEGGHVDLYAPPWIDRWQNFEPSIPVKHAWMVHGANVDGQDMVPIWLRKQSISLAASLLRPVGGGEVTRDDLKSIVADDYGSSGYAAQEQKAEEFHRFLTQMHPGDLVVTVSKTSVHVGRITGPAEFVDSSDRRSNLRRSVAWGEHSCALADVPSDLATSFTSQSEVVDVSKHLDSLNAILKHQPVRPTDEVRLPDATPELAHRLHVGVDWLQECVDLLRHRRQIIFYGPPGTGKTYLAQELARHITDAANMKLVQFHPAYSYEDFFEGFRPRVGHGGQIGFELKPGPLRLLVDKAAGDPDTAYVLIIDEINRGNLPKIFGELYFLLEYRDQAIDLMYSADSAEPFSLPKNIFVIGTMNTADRSIALVDAALRRRFAFVPLHPSAEPTSGILSRWLKAKGCPTYLADLHDALNARITDTDFKIGPSYFMRERLLADSAESALKLMWRTDIVPLLEEHHYGDQNINVVARYGLDALKAAIAAKNSAAGSTTPEMGEGDVGTDSSQ